MPVILADAYRTMRRYKIKAIFIEGVLVITDFSEPQEAVPVVFFIRCSIAPTNSESSGILDSFTHGIELLDK